MVDEDLVVSKLASGDRPSIYCTGMVAAHSLKACGMAIFVTDVLGRVYLLPPEFAEIKKRPRLRDNELDALGEDEAIRLLVKQGDDEEAILTYLKRRQIGAKEE